MTTREKEITAGLLTMTVVFGWYCSALYQDYQMGALAGPGALAAAAERMLYTILAGVAVQIAVVIALNIFEGIVTGKDMPEGPVDERERLVELRVDSWFMFIAGAGFVGGLLHLALGRSPVLALNIMFLGWALSTVVSAVVQLIVLRRGY